MYGKQTHSSNYMNLLECLHDLDESVTHPIPYPESSPTPSHMQVAMNENHFETKVFVFNHKQPSDINSGQTPIIYFVDNPLMYINWADSDD